MKKIFLLMAVLGLGLTSCDKSFGPENRETNDGGDINVGGGNNNGDDDSESDDSENKQDEVYWGDNVAYHLWFNLVDGDGNSILDTDKEAISEIEIMYNGEKYIYNGDDTRAAAIKPLAIRINEYKDYVFGFGDFIVGDHSQFTITFRGNSWEVDQQSQLNPDDINGDLIIDVTINGVTQSSGLFELIVN